VLQHLADAAPASGKDCMQVWVLSQEPAPPHLQLLPEQESALVGLQSTKEQQATQLPVQFT
jgi:anti-sigma-K factor RskA